MNEEVGSLNIVAILDVIVEMVNEEYRIDNLVGILDRD
jgi:hypothetical protein